jgi:zinc/manganese transport system substrate-binding protein
MSSLRLLVPLVGFFAAALLIAGCAGADDEASNGEMTVTATTTHVADLARNVGGERVEVRSLLSANSDPHDYDVRPSDVRSVAGSEVVLRSGGEIDEWLEELVHSAGGDARVVSLIDAVDTIERGAHVGEDTDAEAHEDAAERTGSEAHATVEQDAAVHADDVDPHWWQDPRNAQAAVERIRDVLIEADPQGATAYRRNAAAYLDSLRRLDDAVAACWARVPEERRKLVTTHDALGYYANRYDLEVIGTVIPSLSTQAQTSAGRVDALVETIRREDVRAIFTERAVSPRVETAIAREAGAEIGRPLWVDALGPADSDGATYIDSMRSNTQAMVEGLTGRSCSLPAA